MSVIIKWTGTAAAAELSHMLSTAAVIRSVLLAPAVKANTDKGGHLDILVCHNHLCIALYGGAGR